MARVLPAEQRFPALEHVLARGRQHQIPAETPNHLRYRLFGANCTPHPSVAALTHIADYGVLPNDNSWWLRADPVTMRADMTRVFTTSCGFADLDRDERLEINRVVRQALRHEGIDVSDCKNGRWCFPLEKPLEFEFTPLHEALGLDVAEALPTSPAAVQWKRLLTEIQVDLHQSEVNTKRRTRGLQEVNSVWFWGGGFVPDVPARQFDRLVSDDPLSRGLALLSGIPIADQDGIEVQDENVLIDWVMSSSDALREAAALEHLVGLLTRSKGKSLVLVGGNGKAWELDRRSQRKFWSRPRPLVHTFAGATAE